MEGIGNNHQVSRQVHRLLYSGKLQLQPDATCSLATSSGSLVKPPEKVLINLGGSFHIGM